jgi:ABC-type transport system involved in multi-copper enzyme maturation permease subunit
MRAIRIIALNTFREIIRDRILYGIVVFALLLIGVSIVLGELSFAEQARISANFGFAGIQLSAAILAMFAGSTLVSREIDKQTVLTLLAKPVSRTQFLAGKFSGLTLVVAVVMLGLAIVLSGLLLVLGLKIDMTFFEALHGIFLEAMLLTSIALFFGSFSRPVMTVVFSVSFFLIGHWVDSLHFFISKSQSEAFKRLAGVVVEVVPNLEKFNWRSAPIYGDPVSSQEVLMASLYCGGWVLILITTTAVIFRRRDFV